MDRTVKFNYDKTVTISVDFYESLIDDEAFLMALRAAGVDNWDGYDYAKEILEEWANA